MGNVPAPCRACSRSKNSQPLSRVKQALDDFSPDLVLVWGDDQHENFKEDSAGAGSSGLAWGALLPLQHFPEI